MTSVSITKLILVILPSMNTFAFLQPFFSFFGGEAMPSADDASSGSHNGMNVGRSWASTSVPSVTCARTSSTGLKTAWKCYCGLACDTAWTAVQDVALDWLHVSQRKHVLAFSLIVWQLLYDGRELAAKDKSQNDIIIIKKRLCFTK